MNKVKRFLFFGIGVNLICTGLCIGQSDAKSDPCRAKLEIQFDKVKRSDRKLNVVEKGNRNSFIVKFMSEFNDSLRVYINEELRFNDFVATDRITGESDKTFGYDYSQSSQVVNMRVESLTKTSCCNVQVNRKYRIIYVFFSKPDKWIIRFSNVNYIH